MPADPPHIFTRTFEHLIGVPLERRLIRRGATPQDAADAAAEAVLQVYRRVATTGDIPENPESYLYRAATYALFGLWGAKAPLEEAVLESVEDHGPSPFDEIAEAEEKDLLERAIATLPEGEKVVFKKRLEGGNGSPLKPFKAIAMETGRTADACCVAWHRALKHLRDEINALKV